MPKEQSFGMLLLKQKSGAAKRTELRMRAAITVIVISVSLAMLGCVFLPGVRAQQIEVAGSETEYITRSRIEDPRPGSFEEQLSAQPARLAARVSLPFVLEGKKTFLLNTILWDDVAFNFNNWDYSQESNYFKRLTAVRYRLGLRHVVSDTLSWNVFVEPSLASDAAVWDSKCLTWLGGVKGDFSFGAQHSLGAVLLYINTFGLNAVYPLVTYSWQGENASFSVSPPLLAAWRYRLNEELHAGFSCRINGGEYALSENRDGKHWVHYYAVIVGPELEWKNKSGIGFHCSTGTVFMHRVRWYIADENIRNVDFKPTLLVRARLKYEI